MAKYSLTISTVISKLFSGNPEGLEIHRAWIDNGKLILDLRGPCIPDVEEVQSRDVMKTRTSVMSVHSFETEFVEAGAAPQEIWPYWFVSTSDSDSK